MFKKESKGVNQIETLSDAQVEQLVDEKVLNRMTKLAKEIRSISPRSDDFVYFSIIFLRAAEASTLDENGGVKKVGTENAWGYFDENWKWHGNVLPHRNNNSDIFPESELKKAASKWIGLPLCRDHESSSVDGVRGIILDTYYDEKFKQVVGLCALDKVNYPDLARKVQTGVIRYGSMGTAVENSICSECQNIARTPQEYCHHVTGRTAHGEVNVGLRPIEYSLVVTPAEPGAVLLKCIASLKSYSKEFNNYGIGNVDEMIGKLNEKQAVHLDTIMKTACGPQGCSIDKRDSIVRSFLNNNGLIKEAGDYKPFENAETSDYSSGKMQDSIANEIESNELEDLNNSSDSGVNLNYNPSTEPLTTIGSKKRSTHIKNTIKNILEEQKMNKERLNKRANIRRKIAYHQGGSEGVEPNTFKSEPYPWDEDKNMHQEFSDGDSGMVSGDKEIKEKQLRASLRERALNRRKVAYFQGGSEGAEPNTFKSEPYPWTEDKNMHQEFPGGDSGMISGDKETKEKLHRASLSGRGISKTAKYSGPTLRTKLLVRKVAGTIDRENSIFQVFAGETKVFESKAGSIFGSELSSNWNWMTSKDYGQEVCRHIRANGLNKTISILKNAQEEPMAPELEMEDIDLSATEEAPAAPETEAAEPAEEMTLEEEGASEEAMKLLTNIEADLSDLKSLINEIEEESPKKSVTFNVDVGGEEGAEVEEVENLDALASDLVGQLKTALAELDDSADEIAMISSTFDNISKLSKKDRTSFNKLAKEAITDGYKILGESNGLKKIASKVSSLIKTSQVHSHDGVDHNHAQGDMAHDHKENDISDEEILSALNEADDMSNSAEMQELEKAAIDLRRERREMLLKRAEAKFEKLASEKVAMEMSGMAKDEDHAEGKMEHDASCASGNAEDHAKDKMEHDADYAKDHSENSAETDEASYANDKMASIKQQLSDKFQSKKASDERENYKIKLRRAYDIALNMQKKGLLAGTKAALDKQVDEVMMFDDRAFESFKRTIANTKSVGTVKIASSLGGVNVGIKEDVAPSSDNLTSDLLTMMWDK